MRKVTTLVFLLLVAPQLAQAQERGFVTGLAGLTFAETTSGLFGAEAGFNITPSLQIVGTYDYMQDVLTAALAEQIRLAERITDLRIEGEIPAQYAAAGLRVNFGRGSNVIPYIQFDAGLGKIDPKLRFFDEGEDITDQVETQLDETNGAVALSAGIRVDFSSNLTAAVAYKWLNIFTDETLKINRLHFAFGARF